MGHIISFLITQSTFILFLSVHYLKFLKNASLRCNPHECYLHEEILQYKNKQILMTQIFFFFFLMIDPLLSRVYITVTRPCACLSYDVACSSNAPVRL